MAFRADIKPIRFIWAPKIQEPESPVNVRRGFNTSRFSAKRQVGMTGRSVYRQGRTVDRTWSEVWIYNLLPPW